MIFDDTIQEKPYTDENEVMCCIMTTAKDGQCRFQFAQLFIPCGYISIPVAFEIIKKPIEYCDLKTRKRKRASLVTKNELMRDTLDVCVQNKLLFRLFYSIPGLHPKIIWYISKKSSKRISSVHSNQSSGCCEQRRLSSQTLHSD